MVVAVSLAGHNASLSSCIVVSGMAEEEELSPSCCCCCCRSKYPHASGICMSTKPRKTWLVGVGIPPDLWLPNPIVGTALSLHAGKVNAQHCLWSGGDRGGTIGEQVGPRQRQLRRPQRSFHGIIIVQPAGEDACGNVLSRHVVKERVAHCRHPARMFDAAITIGLVEPQVPRCDERIHFHFLVCNCGAIVPRRQTLQCRNRRA
jgi:hypothetical protein